MSRISSPRSSKSKSQKRRTFRTLSTLPLREPPKVIFLQLLRKSHFWLKPNLRLTKSKLSKLVRLQRRKLRFKELRKRLRKSLILKQSSLNPVRKSETNQNSLKLSKIRLI